MQKESLVAAVKESTSCYSPSPVTVSPYRQPWSVGDLTRHMFWVCAATERHKRVCLYFNCFVFIVL